MSSPFERLTAFLAELKRRKVYRVAVAYLAVAFLGLQAAMLLVPATTLPDWADDLVIFLAAAGFPVALVLAWAFEVTPDGVRRTAADEETDDGKSGSRAATAAWLFLGLVAVGAATGWLLVRGGEEEVPERSLAVLPFSSVGGEASDQFARGIHDDLVTRLSAVSGLRVTSRTSVRQYRESSRTVPEIADELGVHWVIEGTVRQSSGRVRVTAQLIEGPSDTHLWAERYDRALSAENVFSIQDDLTRRIASALEVELSAEERARLAHAPTRSLEAYRLYVQGRTLLDSRTEPGMRRALVFFRRAVEADSGYARAWAGIAGVFYELFDYGYRVPDDWLEQARLAAGRAVSLDPQLPEAHVARAMVRYVQQDGPAALEALGRAVELRSGYAEAHNKLAWVNQILGRPDVALAAARRAVELDPLAPEPRSNLSTTLLSAGDFEGALAEARRARELQSDYATGRFYVGVALHHLGRHAEALEVLRGLSVPWAGAGPEATVALARAASGDRARARADLERLEGGGTHPLLTGAVRAALGDRERAFAAFGRIERWDTDADWAILAARYFYPDVLDPLRADPRYRGMIRSLDRDWGMEAEVQ